MKKFIVGTLMAATTLGLLLPATAEKEGKEGRDKSNHQRRWDPSKMAEMHEKRMSALHEKLNLKPEQESAWQSYIQKTKPQVPSNPPNREEMANMKAPERMEKMLQMSRERQTRMEGQLGALKDFYAQLSPEQQGIFDKQWGHHGGHHGPGGHGGRGDKKDGGKDR